MAIWILTIGNSDIALKSKDTWLTDYEKTSAFTQYGLYDVEPTEIPGEYGEYTAPARSVGEIYTPLLEDEELRELALEEDLTFPLIENYSGELQSRKLELEKIFVLLSDQSIYFAEDDRRSDNSPYWKDTITLWPILQQRLASKFPDCEVCQVVLEPEDRGLDHWDSTLTLVKEKIKSLKIPASTEIYVSHQAGTPAMSSALQFVCLSLFGSNVKFLVSNEYTKQPDLLPSSKYLKGIKLEQAKALIFSSPGAARNIIRELDNISIPTELQELVDFFNIKKATNSLQSEFDLDSASRRIIDALELIRIFVDQESYLSAITLLSAAQETFAKAAILKEVRFSFPNESNILEWSFEGLHVPNAQFNEAYQFLRVMQCPVNNLQQDNYDKSWRRSINRNSLMLKWLQDLNSSFETWSCLRWSFKHNKKYEIDLRNRLVHNLMGAEDKDVIRYLEGKEQKSTISNDSVLEVFEREVYQPFRKALKVFRFTLTPSSLEAKQQAAIAAIDRLN